MNVQLVKSIETETNTRDYLFDNIKALLIFLVVVGHTINLSYYKNDMIKTVYVFIYFFHMPAFIFISGYFSKNIDKCREGAVINYFIPYIFLTLFTYLQVGVMPLESDPAFLIRIFLAPSGCWFLLTMFIWKLLLKDLSKIRFCIPLLYMVGLVAGFSKEFGIKMSLGRLCVFSVFFMIGYFMEEKHINYIRQVPKVVSCIFLYLFYRVAKYYVVEHDIPTEVIMNRWSFRDLYLIDDFIFRIVFYVIATVFIFILINLFTQKRTMISKIGKNTFSVYIFHTFFIRMIDFNLYNYMPFKEHPELYLVFVIGVSIIITYILSRDISMRVLTGFLDFVNNIIFRKPVVKRLYKI